MLGEEKISEEKNILKEEIAHLGELQDALSRKISNFRKLDVFIQQLNTETELGRVCELIVNETFMLFGKTGNVILYLVNDKNRRLELRSVRKMTPSFKIKDKTGDVFDRWSLRHQQPLLVESVLSDFRFDAEKLRQEVSRPLGSVICAPLVTESNLLGILRVDSPDAGTYFADDMRFLAVISDIAKLVVENALYLERMRELSVTDGLTGVALRRRCMDRLREEWIRAQRQQLPLSFLMLDIDYFKNFNDRFGHMGGDFVLKHLAAWLVDFFDLPGVVVGRYGGEEFCVILPSVSKNEAIRLADLFRKNIEDKKLTLRRDKVSVTISAGVAAYPDDAHVVEDLVRLADEALLQAKRNGRNRVCCA